MPIPSSGMLHSVNRNVDYRSGILHEPVSRRHELKRTFCATTWLSYTRCTCSDMAYGATTWRWCNTAHIQYGFQNLPRGPFSHTVPAAYIGDDYPTDLPTRMRPVALTFASTARFDLAASPAEAHAEWLALRVPWGHQGYVRLGPARRQFAVALFHELHCVDTLARATFNASEESASAEHVHHCLNYLRQAFLCAADAHLEPGDSVARDHGRAGEGATRVCRDWSAVYTAAQGNFDAWREWTPGNLTEVSRGYRSLSGLLLTVNDGSSGYERGAAHTLRTAYDMS